MNDSDTPIPSPNGKITPHGEDFIPSDLSTLSFDEARNALPFFEESDKDGKENYSYGSSEPPQRKPSPSGSSPLMDIPAVKTSPPEKEVNPPAGLQDPPPQEPWPAVPDGLPSVPDDLPGIPEEDADDSFPPVPDEQSQPAGEDLPENDLPPVPNAPSPTAENLPAYTKEEENSWEDDLTTLQPVPGSRKKEPSFVPPSYSEDEDEDNYPPRRSSAKKKKPQKGNPLTTKGIIVICALVLLLAGGGGYKVYQNRQQEEAEQCKKAMEDMKQVRTLNGIALSALLELPLEQFPKDMAETGKALRDTRKAYTDAIAAGKGKTALESSGKIARDYQELVWNDGIILSIGKWHADKKEWDKAEPLLTALEKKGSKEAAAILAKNPALAKNPPPPQKPKDDKSQIAASSPQNTAEKLQPIQADTPVNLPEGKVTAEQPSAESTDEEYFKQAIRMIESKGSAQDIPEGVSRLEELSLSGHVQAALTLASYYDSGKFLTRNKEKALEYYDYALLNGDKTCQEQSQTLRTEITEKTERTRPVPAYEITGNYLAVEIMETYSKIPFLVCLDKDSVHLYDSFTGAKITVVPLEKGTTGTTPHLEMNPGIPFCAISNPQTGRLTVIDLDNAKVCFQTTLDATIPANRLNRKIFSDNKLVFWEGENLLCYQLTPRKKEADLVWKLSKKDLTEDQPPSPTTESDGFLFSTFGDKSNDYQQNLAVWLNGLMIQVDFGKSPAIRQTTAKSLGVSPESKLHVIKKIPNIVQFRNPKGKAWLLNLFTMQLYTKNPISFPDDLTFDPSYKDHAFYSLTGNFSQAGKLTDPLPEVKNVPQAKFYNWTAGQSSNCTVFCLQYQEEGQEKCTLIGSPTSEIKNLWREDIPSPHAGCVIDNWVFLPKNEQVEIFFIKAGPNSKVVYPMPLPPNTTIAPGASNYSFLTIEQRNAAGEITKVCTYKNANNLSEFVEKTAPATKKKMPAQLEKDLKNVISTYARARNAGNAANIAFFFGNSVNYMYREGVSSREDIRQDIQEGLDRWVERSVKLEKMDYSMNDTGSEIYAQVTLKFSYLDANGKRSSGKTKESWTIPLSGSDYGKITVWSEKVVK